MQLVQLNAESVAGDVISLSHTVADNSLQHKQGPVSSNLELVPGSGHNTEDNVVYMPQNVPERVVYVSQPNPHHDTRVTNVMQGREFQIENNVSEEVKFHNKVPERVVYISPKSEGETRGPNVMLDKNTTSERIVYVQGNIPEDNVVSQNTKSEIVSHGPNPTAERIVYVPYPTPVGESNMPNNTTNIVSNDGKRVPVRVVYVPHNTPGPNDNYLPGMAIYAPNNKPEENLSLPQNMPIRTPSPDRTQERALEIVQQVMKMANNMSNQDDEEKKTPENIVYMAQPPMYSPYMFGGGGFMPQIQQPMGYLPQMQQPMGYMQPMAYGPQLQPQTSYSSQQNLLQPQTVMRMMTQPLRYSPTPHRVQDGLYMSPSPSHDVEQSFTPEDNLPQLPESGGPDSGNGLPDIIDSDIISDDCSSWFDCCCCLFSGNNE